MPMPHEGNEVTVDHHTAQFLENLNYSDQGPTLYMGHRLLMDAALHLTFVALPPEAQARGERPWNAVDLDAFFAKGA